MHPTPNPIPITLPRQVIQRSGQLYTGAEVQLAGERKSVVVEVVGFLAGVEGDEPVVLHGFVVVHHEVKGDVGIGPISFWPARRGFLAAVGCFGDFFNGDANVSCVFCPAGGMCDV